MTIETSTFNLVVGALIGLQVWMVNQLYDLKIEVQKLKVKLDAISDAPGDCGDSAGVQDHGRIA